MRRRERQGEALNVDPSFSTSTREPFAARWLATSSAKTKDEHVGFLVILCTHPIAPPMQSRAPYQLCETVRK